MTKVLNSIIEIHLLSRQISLTHLFKMTKCQEVLWWRTLNRTIPTIFRSLISPRIVCQDLNSQIYWENSLNLIRIFNWISKNRMKMISRLNTKFELILTIKDHLFEIIYLKFTTILRCRRLMYILIRNINKI